MLKLWSYVKIKKMLEFIHSVNPFYILKIEILFLELQNSLPQIEESLKTAIMRP